MFATENLLALLAASGISLFGLVLAWASWSESRHRKAKREPAAPATAHPAESFKQAA